MWNWYTMSEITWYCFARVLPKIGYTKVSDRDDRFICYKDNEPLLSLQKARRYHPRTLKWILRRVQLSKERLDELLRQCNAQPPP